MQHTKLSTFQFFVLVIFFSIGTSILVVPSALAMNAKQDAWLAAIVGTILGGFIIWFYTTIALWFPNLTYVQLNEKIFGKWVGKITSFSFVFMSILFTATLITYSGFFLNIEMLPNTPLPIISILNCIVLIITARLGLETLARSGEIFIFVFFFLFILLVLLLVPKINMQDVEPFFRVPFLTISLSSLKLTTVSAMNAIVLLMIFPAFVQEIEKAKKSFLAGYIIGGVVIIIITGLCIFILGSSATARQIYPSYVLAKQISVGGFVNRIEALMAGLWILGLFIKSSLYFYASLLGLAQLFHLKDYKTLILPLSFVVGALSVTLYPNVIYQQTFDRTTSVSLSIVICLFIPLMMTIVYKIRWNKWKMTPNSTKKTK